jgi:predicted deacylase
MRSTKPLAALAAGALFIASAGPAAAADDWPDGYQLHHTYAEIQVELEQLAAAHPDLVNVRSMGRSYEGRKLWVAKISDHVAADEPEPEAYIQGGVHANEHTSTEQSLAVIHWLVDDYGNDPRTTAIVDSTEIWVAPMVNPDGATFDISGGAFHNWRKDRKPNTGSAEVGTDINRNFGYRWGCCGHSSADPASRYYRGPKPWSTPEARRIRDFLRGRRIDGVQQVRIALDLHGHGGFVTYPYGYTPTDEPRDMKPGDRNRFLVLAQGVADRDGYVVHQYGDMLGADGMFMDWAYARQGIMLLTVELGPPPKVEDGNYLTDEDLPGIVDANRDALLWFLEQAATA